MKYFPLSTYKSPFGTMIKDTLQNSIFYPRKIINQEIITI